MNLRTILLLPSLLLGACASGPVVQEPLPEPNYSAQEKRVPDGAIFQESGGLLWFEDRLASRVGDALTVILQESTQAQKSARTSTSKETDYALEVPAFGALTGKFDVDGEIGSSHGFGGAGDSSQSNSLSGELTVLVIERLPNGYLRVAGEKKLDLNQGSESLRLTGIVRPEDIRPDNSVLSTRIASAQIAYNGSGPLAQANAMGWLARFFNSPLWPF